jgi:hypothetical protein
MLSKDDDESGVADRLRRQELLASPDVGVGIDAHATNATGMHATQLTRRRAPAVAE